MYRCSMALAICSESKARIWFLFPRLSSVYVILSLPRIPFLATALVPYPTAKPRRLAACSPCISILFALSKFKSDLPSALPLSGRVGGKRPFFFGGPKSKAPLPAPSAAQRLAAPTNSGRLLFGVPLWLSQKSYDIMKSLE